MAIITLATDINTRDFIVGAIKGQILQEHAQANIVDITHNLSQNNFPQSAYICASAYNFFPEQTIHVLILNLFETQPDHFLVAKHKNRYIICPDNGILTMLYPDVPEHIISVPITYNEPITTLIYTRKVAEVIRKINEKYRLDEIGNPPGTYIVKNPIRHTYGANWIDAQILFIDNFENIVVNIRKEDFKEIVEDKEFSLELTFKDAINKISENYAEHALHEKLAWFNSAGYLELSINGGNMAGMFGFDAIFDYRGHNNHQNNLFYKTVKIHFKETDKQVIINKIQLVDEETAPK